MNPDLFPILYASTTVKMLLGTTPPVIDSAGDADYGVLRVFPYGKAPEGVVLPYCVYGVINAQPENYLDKVPDVDSMRTQVSIYAKTESSLSSCYTAIRDALEPSAHMISFVTPDIDADTELYSCRMEFDFWHDR